MVKFETREGHLQALDKFLGQPERYNLRLNLKTSMFEITSRKLLRHIVSQQGIEIDVDNIKAIQEMSVPKIEKEVRGAPCYQGDWIMQVQMGPKEKPWFYDLNKFIESREYPEEATAKEMYALRIQAKNYISHEGVLYKRMVSSVQLRCVTKVEAQVVMEEIHKGV
eukprot:XP_015573018.1 uncharacterized protein LOC107261029 [Ricinus communis]